jgi:hypothetical protein
LANPKIQKFVYKVIEEQGIDPTLIKTIKIKVYPFGASEDDRVVAKREKINIMRSHYLGHYVPYARRIDIYPPRLHPTFIEATTAKHLWDDNYMRRYLYRYEPLNTLIHEYLHIKYGSERTVERLSKKYMVQYEKETRGKIEYSNKTPFCVWLEQFIITCKSKGFEPIYRDS